MMTDAVVEVIEARRVIEIAQHLSNSLEVFAPKSELVELPLLPAAVIELQNQKNVLLEIVTSGPQGPRGDSGAKASVSDHPDNALSATAEGTLFAPYLEYSTTDW